jgi:hypothetical protein
MRQLLSEDICGGFFNEVGSLSRQSLRCRACKTKHRTTRRVGRKRLHLQQAGIFKVAIPRLCGTGSRVKRSQQ